MVDRSVRTAVKSTCVAETEGLFSFRALLRKLERREEFPPSMWILNTGSWPKAEELFTAGGLGRA